MTVLQSYTKFSTATAYSKSVIIVVANSRTCCKVVHRPQQQQQSLSNL